MAYIDYGDKAAEQFAKDMTKVMASLERALLDMLGSTRVGDAFNASAILNSRPVMLAALNESGYTQLANDFVSQYPDITAEVRKTFSAADFPPPRFSTPTKELFSSIAQADLEGFANIGTNGLDQLRLNLFRQAVSNEPFSSLVETVRDATVGTAKNGAPMANYAETHANTAIQNFQGEVLREAGESIGAEDWEVVGPLDQVTRPACLDALADPIRTQDEWLAADYWGGAPGGWNCRHQLFPYFG